MQNNPSDPSAVPGDPTLTDQALLNETDLQRCIESLQSIICDLLIENERLRQHSDKVQPSRQALERPLYKRAILRQLTLRPTDLDMHPKAKPGSFMIVEVGRNATQ
jgi:hypothetical protein